MSEKYTLVALVENEPGVLNRVASMFRRRAINVDSLTVGRTHKPHVSRMTIVLEGDRSKASRAAENLRKLINILDVQLISDNPHISRDLALIKIAAIDADSRNTVTEICDRFPARIIDVGPEVMIVEMTAREELIEELIERLRPVGIVEMIRTGVVAMGRGTRISDKESSRPMLVKANGSSNHF